MRLLNLDALDGLPRLFTTAVFVAVALLAWWARRRSADGAAAWWGMVSLVGAGLALAKLSTLHGILKNDAAPLVALAQGLGVTTAAVVVLGWAGRR